MQHTQADPPVAVDSGYIDAGSGIERQQAIRADCQFAAFTRPHLRQRCCIAPVQLGAIPPVCGSIEIRRGQIVGARGARGVAVCAQNAHGVFWPRVVIAERDFPGILFLVLSMTEPVVNHELDPGGSQHIEDGDRLKAIASQQFEADRAGIRHKNPRFVGIDIFQWDIAPEACSGTAHRRMFQVVVSSIRCASGEVVFSLTGCSGLSRAGQLHAGGIVEIALSQDGT